MRPRARFPSPIETVPFGRRLSRAVRVTLACVSAVWLPVAECADAPKEYHVKAALLYNFTQFVDWPPTAFAHPDAPLVIGILGRDPFGLPLDRLVAHERVRGHPIVVTRLRHSTEAASCHLLFIASSERSNASRILAFIAGRPTLSIAEFDGFLERGGTVALHRAPNNKIRLRVNLDAARASGLTVSAKLLRVAEVVPPSQF